MTAPMTREELLPCPFCGGAAIVEEVPTGLGAGGVSFSVGCDSPDEVACMGYQNLQTFSRRSEAIAGWNKRDPAVAQTAWRPFHPNDWHLSGFCYPCIVVAPDGEVGTPCDPWTLPPDNDWTGWLCCALPDDYPARLSNQGASK